MKTNLKRAGITTFIAAMVLGVAALAQEVAAQRAPYWPDLKGKPTLAEWFADVPWFQKLGTFAGNSINVPLIMPYEVLPVEATTHCIKQTPPLSEEDCMIETGVINILGYHRIDTLYDHGDQRIKNAAECAPPNQCTEVRLEISNFRASSMGSTAALVPQKIGSFARQPVYGGFYITDATTYAPQMLWEMSHYCDSKFSPAGDMQDPICYGDYFSPMNDGFHVLPGTRVNDWPRSVPWSVFPAGRPPAEPDNQCKPDETKCVIALGRFAMGQVPKNPANLQYKPYNDLLFAWFNNALTAFPKELGPAEIQNHFPWSGNSVTWDTFIYPRAVQNPFLGSYTPTAQQTAPAEKNPTCDTGLNGAVWKNPSEPAPPNTCTDAPHYQAAGYAYPLSCTLADLAKAVAGSTTSADSLRQCGLNYEIHPNGWLAQWPPNYRALVRQGPFNYGSNQYGRTSFLFAGIPGMQMAVSFYKDPTSDSGMSIYEQVHNASIFSLFLPAANIADVTRAMGDRNYTDTAFYHTLLMSNHMESDPEQFAEGIRGKVLWHNEYRMQPMYAARDQYTWLKDRTFQAAFDPSKAPAPFHNNTCDGCHVRNGSGVPINTTGKVDVALQEYMADKTYVPYANGTTKDYTFTGQIQPMKLVFFDLQRDTTHLDASRYSEPLSFPLALIEHPPRTVPVGDLYYNNKVMNFYGDSFHAIRPGYNYAWNYETANPNRMVVNVARVNSELNKIYAPRQIKLGAFQTDSRCEILPPPAVPKPWPSNCDDINNAAIHAAIDGGTVGYMLLNGKRLGNLGAIEAIPNQAVLGFRASQTAALGDTIAGEIVWNAGSRDGIDGKVHKECRTHTLTDCYIGRFGWLGDRVSLEDQVANAAFVEMNMTTIQGYKKLYPNGKVEFPIRYAYPNCGPADKTCVESKGNSDLSERDIERMADYARWLGSPTRSEIQVSQPEVIAGEKIFKRLQCDTCHVIKRIDIVPEDTMLTKNFRDRLATHIGGGNKPFLSYIGTDLLMHDMGYLSQVGDSSQSIRDANGVVKPGFQSYVQKVRTPPLKGLRFNNYVTDAHRNTKSPGQPGCDFLLHDGRACNAIEAAFLHDGPAIKKLSVIEGLNALSDLEVRALRAFLYSL